jgi:hypothetical protein
MQSELQAHCQSHTSQRINQSFVKELAKPAHEKKCEAFTNTLKINNEVSNFKIFLPR